MSESLIKVLRVIAYLNERGEYPTAWRVIHAAFGKITQNQYVARYQVIARAIKRGDIYTRQEENGAHNLVITANGRTKLERKTRSSERIIVC